MKQRQTSRTRPRSTSEGGPTVRVLIESADAALAVSDFAAFTAAGVDVALCHGPERAPAECPVVRGQPCALAAGADVILFDLGPSGFEVLEAGRRLHPETPVVVRGGRRLPANTSVEGQISAIRRAAEGG